MFCSNCGTQNADTAVNCHNCGAPLAAARPAPPAAGMQGYPPPGGAAFQQAPRVPNYLVHAILVTLFCCLPFGIVSIVYAAQVNGKLQAGDYNGAVECSNKAKTWAWISLGIGLAFTLIYVVLAVIGALAEQGGQF